MARTRFGKSRGGGTAASPRRSARLAGGNQDVHGRLSTHEEGASSRSPVPSPAHSRSPTRGGHSNWSCTHICDRGQDLVKWSRQK